MMIMAAVERTYNVPLRKEWLKVPLHKRAKKAVKALRENMIRHMKTEDVLVGPKLNEEIWKNGIKNPPHHVKVTAVKDDKGVCRVELFGHKFVQKEKAEPKKKKAAGLAGKIQEKVEGLKETKKEAKAEEKTEAKEKKPAEKKERPVKAAPKKAEAAPEK